MSLSRLLRLLPLILLALPLAAEWTKWQSEYDIRMTLPLNRMPSLLVSEPDDDGLIGIFTRHANNAGILAAILGSLFATFYMRTQMEVHPFTYPFVSILSA